MLLVRQRQHAQQTRHTDCAPARHDFIKALRFAVQHEHVRGREQRCGFTAIENLKLLAIVVHQKRAAADAAGLRFNQRQHQLHRNRCVNRRSAGFENLQTGGAGQRVG